MEIGGLYEMWAKRDGYCESRFFDTIIDDFCQYKGGTAEGQQTKGKTFNAGYELFIYAFFLGLYYGKRRPLVGDIKKFGQPVGLWGNVRQEGRVAYPKIREYIFAALIAKTDVDFIKLDKGEITPEEVVSQLTKTMWEYANAGFYLMNEKLESIPEYFTGNDEFLNFLIQHCPK
jgi:hypothetical protein